MLFKRGLIYFARVKDENGKWIKKTCNTRDRKVAEIRHRELERLAADPAYRAANETTVGNAIKSFIASRRRKGCADGTLHMYDVKTRHIASLMGEDTLLAWIDAATVDDYLDARLKAGASRNTLGKEITTLRGMLKIARREGKFDRSLDTILPTEWSIDYEPRERALSMDELQRLLAYLESPNIKKQGGGTVRNTANQAAMVAFIVASNARLSEAYRAERGHIGKEAITVPITKTKRKTGVKARQVPITKLSRWLVEEVLRGTEGRKGLLFDPWANIQRDLADACESLGIDRCSPNDLRRTYGTWLRAAGVAPQLIGNAMGHTDSRMVERIYGRLKPEDLKKLITEAVGK